MGFDPLTLALIASTGASIFGATQAGRGGGSPALAAIPPEQKTVDGTQTKKKRPRFRAAQQQLALGTPTLGVAGNVLS